MIPPSSRVPAVVLLLCLSQPARAGIFLVTEAYDAVDAAAGDGICADADGHCTLRAAVQESNTLSGPDIIVLPEGAYSLSIPGNAEHAAATGDLDLLDAVTVRGQGPDRTRLDAGGLDRAFEAINAGTVLIQDLTIENGVAGANTPGYFAVNSGGAISVVGNGSTTTLRHVVLRNNRAQSGGGLYNVFSTVEIHDSTLHDNLASPGSGGGIAEGLASYTRLYNVTLSGNRAAQSGGGMATSNNTALFYNVTVTGNLADSDANGSGDGGGVSKGITAPTLVNSIVAGNGDTGGEAPDCAGSLTSNGYNLVGDNSGCSMTSAAGDQIGTAAAPLDPGLQQLAVLQSGLPVHALAPASPAVGTGSPVTPGSGGDACLGTDARGAKRTLSTPCDIGAYEVAVFGRSFTVNSQNDRVDASIGDGVCETAAGNAECTLRAAIQETNALDGRDTIQIPAGSYAVSLAGTGEDQSSSGDFDVKDALRIVGAGKDQTYIDGAGLDRVFHLSTTGRIEIEGLSIRNGAAPGGNGGGILLENTGGMDLTDVQIFGNSAQYGGGIYAALWSWMNDGMVNLTRCDISGNTAALYGGGFANFTFRVSRIAASTLSGNSAQLGGGLFNSYMSMALVTGSTISGNQAQTGGGIALLWGRGVVTLVNSTLSGNTATLSGGGINVGASDSVRLFSSTVTANRARATADGGGIYAAGTVHLGNSALAGNTDDDGTAPDCAAALTSLGHNLIGTDTGCTIAAASGDRIGTAAAPIDPRLDALATHGDRVAYHLPLDDSPLLSAGDTATPGSGGSSCPGIDQRGVDRMLNAPCDIGAVERRRADIGLTARVTPTSVVRGGEVTYAVQLINAGPDTATGIRLNLTPPSGSVYQTVSGSGWSCTAGGTDILCQGADLYSGAMSDLTLTLLAPDSSGTLTTLLNATTTSWETQTADNTLQLSYLSDALPVVTGQSDLVFTGTPDSLQVAADLILADGDSDMLSSATVRFASGFSAGEDLLYAAIYSGLTADWDDTNGILTLSGTAPLSTYQTVLRNVRYINLADAVTAGERHIEIAVSDGTFTSAAVNMSLTLALTPAVATEIASQQITAAAPSSTGGAGRRILAVTAEADELSAADTAAQNDSQATVSGAPGEEASSSADSVVVDGEMQTVPTVPLADADVQSRGAQLAGRASGTRISGHTAQTGSAAEVARQAPAGLDQASIASAEFWEEVAAMREQMAEVDDTEDDKPRQFALYTAKTMSMFLFAGATNWYLKSSSLLASLFSSLPLWTPFDPLPILALSRRMKRRRQRDQAAAAALELRYSTGMTRLLDTHAESRAAAGK